MNENKEVELYWQKFLNETGQDMSLKYYECFHFDLTEKTANGLLNLVLAGIKKATASSLFYFEKNNIPLPTVGEYSIITDWSGIPRCIIKTTQVQTVLFKDMIYEICKREGEDDTLKSWQDNHIKFFTEEGKIEGYSFSWEMPVVFEDFEVVYK